MSHVSRPGRNVLLLIMAAVIVWGSIHALGAFRGSAPVGPNALRGLIVLGCFAAFLGFWGLLLSRQKPRPKRPLPLAKPPEH